MGLALDTGGGIGAANMGAAGKDVCNGGVGLGGAGLSCVEVGWPPPLHGLLKLLARLEDTAVVGGGQLSVVVTLLRLRLLTLLEEEESYF